MNKNKHKINNHYCYCYTESILHVYIVITSHDYDVHDHAVSVNDDENLTSKSHGIAPNSNSNLNRFSNSISTIMSSSTSTSTSHAISSITSTDSFRSRTSMSKSKSILVGNYNINDDDTSEHNDNVHDNNDRNSNSNNSSGSGSGVLESSFYEDEECYGFEPFDFCGHSKKCISDLVKIDEDVREGQTNDLSTLEYHLFKEQNEYLNLVDSMLIVVPYLDRNAFKSVCNVRKDDDYYKSICHKLCETKSLAEFKELGKDALQNGLFLPESTQSYDHSNKFEFCFEMAILELSFMDGTEVGEDGDGDDVSLSLNSLIDVFNKRADIRLRKCEKNSTFCGFVKDGKVRVPICLNSELFNQYNKYLDSLPITEILNIHQYNMTLPEGVSIVDRAIPRDLRDDLMNQIDDLAKTQEVDYHLHSRDIIRDLVHPALYAYFKGISKVESLNEVPPFKMAFEPKELHEPEYYMQYENNPEEDYWGRPYEVSLKYQWLPTYFDIYTDGNCKICDYINNLAPRSALTELYSSLEKLFTRALPQLESVYNYGLDMRTRLCIRSKYEDYFVDTWISPFKLLGSNNEHYSLKGQRLQVITKIVDYEIGPGETYEGVWHVEGMSREEIVATAIYFLHHDDDIKGGNILFKRVFDKDEAQHIRYGTGQCHHPMLDKIFDEGLVPLGQVETLANRLIVFPNSHVHKVRKIENLAEAAVSDKQKISEKKHS
jgi:hypothetical protein